MRAVELFQEDDPGELVGKRDRSERETPVDVVEIEPVGPTDHEAQILAALAPGLQEPAQGDRVEHVALAVEEGHEGALGQTPGHVLVLADLDEFEADVAAKKGPVVLGVVGEGRAEPADGDDDDPHYWDTTFR